MSTTKSNSVGYKYECLTCCILIAFLTFNSGAIAGTWQTVYSTDFSSDPNWITNCPSRYYWNSTDETYSINDVHINDGGYYSYHDVGQGWNSFKLDWDIKVSSWDNQGAGTTFGILDQTLESCNTGRFALVWFDGSECIGLRYRNSEGQEGYTWSGWSGGPCYSQGYWYHVILEYDQASRTLTADVTDGNGGSVKSLSFSDVGSFPTDMTFLGSSGLRNGGYGARGAQMWVEIDNVNFATPEPCTLSLLTTGALGILRWRK